MNADRGGVDHLNIVIVSMRGSFPKDPRCCHPPAIEVIRAGRVHLSRKGISTRDALCVQAAEDSVQHWPVAASLAHHTFATVRARHYPIEIRQHIASL